MSNDRPVKLQWFESAHIRTVWDESEEKWWFSALDIVAALTDQPDYAKVRNYWKWLKNKLKQEGCQLVSETNQLKLEAPDGRQTVASVRVRRKAKNKRERVPLSPAASGCAG